jgi:hypothetical protein
MKPFDESESPGEVSRHRAAHWAEFYERLTAFEMEILDKMLSLAQHLPPDQVAAVELTNINPLRELIKDFQDRATTWRAAADGQSTNG